MSQPLKCIVVDDEPFAIELLLNQLCDFEQLTVVNTFSNPLTALVEISTSEKADIIFLDVDMPELSGIQLADKIREKCKYIVFVTAHSQFALDAFGVKAYDYLLKPIDPVKFFDLINSILKIEAKSSSKETASQKNLFIKGDLKGKFLNILIEDIILIYTQSHQIFIETISEKYQTNDTMRNIEERLKFDNRFLRVHQSNLINTEKIIKVEGNTIYLINDWKVPVSENYKKTLLKYINSQLLNLE